jgi:hypothetical protein
VHARRSGDFTYANGGVAAAKLGREAGLFGLISIRLNYLHVIFAHLSVLRYRCDEPAAKWWHQLFGLRAHGAAFGFLRGGGKADAPPCRDRCHEIAENIPQRSRVPVTFRSARA